MPDILLVREGSGALGPPEPPEPECFDAPVPGLALPAPLHPSRRLCLPVLLGIACVRCMTTSLATMMDKLPHLTFGVAKEHHVLDFPHRDVPLAWEGHLDRPATRAQYAAGFPTCAGELAFDFTPGLLSEKDPFSAARRAKDLVGSARLLVVVPEPLPYLARRLERGTDLRGEIFKACARGTGRRCGTAREAMAWLEDCLGPVGSPATRCGRDLVERGRVFSSACPWRGVGEWRRAGWDDGAFAFLPMAEVAAADPERAEAMLREIFALAAGEEPGEAAFAGGALGPLRGRDLVAHENSSYAARGGELYGAACEALPERIVAQQEQLGAALEERRRRREAKDFRVEPRRATGMAFPDHVARRLEELYLELCTRPLAEWLSVEPERLMGAPRRAEGGGGPGGEL